MTRSGRAAAAADVRIRNTIPTPVTDAADVAASTAAADEVPAVQAAEDATARTSLPDVVDRSSRSVTVPIVAPVAVIVSADAAELLAISKPSSANTKSSVVMPTSAATVTEKLVPAVVSEPSLCEYVKPSPPVTGRTP